jgi:hypothetical protein
MATYGLATQNAAGQLYMYSPTMNGVFYNTNGTYSTNSTVPSTGFVTQFAMATPITAMSASWSSSSLGGSITINGGLNSTGTYFYSPTAYVNGGTTPVLAPAVTPATTQVYAFGVPTTPTGYGFFAVGASGSSVAVDATHKAYYIQPKSDGTYIRTGTATSLSSSTAADNSSYSQPTSASITFERSFLNPPLIFITESSGPIALNYMTRDGSGLYNGMSIVAGSSFSNPSNPFSGTGPYSGNTYTFSYFLVANEEPYYGTLANYGIRVFNNISQKVFDSSYFCPNFTAFTITKPYSYINGATGTYNATSTSFTKTSNVGVCLNNLNSITGSTVYCAHILGGIGFGPLSLFGRFATVTPTSAVLSGTGACAITRPYTYPVLYWSNSFDYTMGNTSTMPVLFCNYPI